MDTLFNDYENYLIGANKDIGLYNFYGAQPGGPNQQRALSLIRYALEDLLEWEVDEIIKKFDDYMIHELKLERVVDFIDYPAEVGPRNPRYILSLLYPDRVRLDFTKMVVDVYKSVLNGTGLFPREYFIGINGFFRYCICLQYLILRYHPCSSLKEIYEFLLSPEGNKFLMTYRLKVPGDQLKIPLVDCIWEITKEEEFSSLYHGLYDFKTKMAE